MKISLVSALLVCCYMTISKANEVCLNETEYDFYMMENLVTDFKKRLESLKENFKEMVHAKCHKTKCPQSSCADDWVSYNGSCYRFETFPARNFEEARAFCKQRESVLLYVQDAAENAFIVRMLGRSKSSPHWLLGLTDQGSEGKWKWIDTSAPATFIKWARGQPEGRTRQNCVVYSSSASYHWHDTECTKRYPFICKTVKSTTGRQQHIFVH
ncbi:perlucin-like protein [Ruditapes philippinarum]|uniref:perlucin-like protein n=1 Tax=Ruditapes philippinarum TaxID=129788 RepID=UPI00295B803F|nr:perlucin-like protein [Ruditapes philippinarum]